MGTGDSRLGLGSALIGDGGQQGAIGGIGHGKVRFCAGAPGILLPVTEGLQQGRKGCMKHNNTPIENWAIEYGVVVIIGPVESSINQNPSMFGLRK
jgi:hypothetical protein